MTPENIDPIKKGKSKTSKKIKKIIDPVIRAEIEAEKTKESTVPPSPPGDEITKQTEEYINKILKNSLQQYQDVIEREQQEMRYDFESLQNIVTEFLTDFIIIGHTLDDRRIVLRVANTPGELDKLTELCKKVFIKMMIQEERGGSD